MLYFPEENLGILQQANSSLTTAPPLLRMLADAMLEEKMEPVAAEDDENGRTDGLTSESSGTPSAWTPSRSELQTLEGVYFSPELEATWTLRVDEDHLKAHHVRLGALTLEPQSTDQFSAPDPLNQIRIERDNKGQPVALRITNGRVRNLRFERR